MLFHKGYYLFTCTFFILFSFYNEKNLVIAVFGGQDLFTSLAQLEALWQNDKIVVNQMEETITKMEKALGVLKMYVKHHYIHQLNQTPNYEYLGHPVNAYHLIRHVASGWSNVLDYVMKDEVYSLVHDLEKLKNRTSDEKVLLPNQHDVEGGAFGIVRLWSQYRYNFTELVENGKVVTTLDNGQKVESEPSVIKLDSFDLTRFAYEATENELYDAAVESFEHLVKKSEEEKKSGIESIDWLFKHKVEPQKSRILLNTTKKAHDHKLDNQGQYGSQRRCNQYPFDPKLRKKKKFKKGYNPMIILDRLTTQKAILHETKPEKLAESKIATHLQVDKLCRGGQLRTPQERANLRSFYSHSASEWLRLGPMKIQVNAHDPAHVVIKNLMSDRECDSMTEFLTPMLNFPPGKMNRKAKSNDWTMKNAWPNELDNVNFEKLNRRIEHITRLRADTSKNYSEPFMCGNYGIGGHYWTHPDYYSREAIAANEAGYRGNRVATILTVMEAPKAGGATVWPYAGISVFPEKGSAIFWHNTFTDADPDEYTQHTACAVLLGNKWIGNKWVGYNAQWNQLKCDLYPFVGFPAIASYSQ